MTQTTRLDKRLTREYLENRTHAEDPPPTYEEITVQLGWWLLPHNGPAPEVPE